MKYGNFCITYRPFLSIVNQMVSRSVSVDRVHEGNMAEGEHFTDADFYQAHFDSKTYINHFYSCPQGHSDEQSYLAFVLGCLSRTFSSGKYRGSRLIEVGCGPSIHTVISACNHYQQLLLSDFTNSNREEIKKWLKNEEGCFNWRPVIEYVCKMEGESPADVEEKLRQRVKLLKCDVLLENPFQPERIEPAECVITSLCLEAACKDLETYSKALGRVVKFLVPGGVLVMVGVLGETFYCVGKTRFSCLRLNKETIDDLLNKLGLSVQEFNVFAAEDRENNTIRFRSRFPSCRLKINIDM